MSLKKRKVLGQRTTGQDTGVEANPVASDNIHGQTDSAGTGNQTPHAPSGTMRVPQLTSAMTPQGNEDVLTLFSGPLSGRSSNQQSMESADERERRYLASLKPASQEFTDQHSYAHAGNSSVSVRMPDERGQDI